MALATVLVFGAHRWASDPARLPEAARAERSERLALARALDEALDEGGTSQPPLGSDWDVLTVTAADPPTAAAAATRGGAGRVTRHFRPPEARALRLTVASHTRAPTPITDAARRWLRRPASDLVALLEAPPRWTGAPRPSPRLLALAAIPVVAAADPARPTIAEALRGHGFTHLVVAAEGRPDVVLVLAPPTRPGS